MYCRLPQPERKQLAEDAAMRGVLSLGLPKHNLQIKLMLAQTVGSCNVVSAPALPSVSVVSRNGERYSRTPAMSSTR